MNNFTEDRKDVLLEIKQLIEENPKDLEIQLNEYHLFDISSVVIDLTEEEIKPFFSNISFDYSASIFEYLEEDDAVQIIKYLPEEKLLKIISNMETDEAVDLLKYLNHEGLKLLNKIPVDKRKELIKVMAYKEDEIGAFMSDSYITIDIDTTVKQAMKKVTLDAHLVEYISIIYILKEGFLVGYIKLKDLIVARASDLIEEIMETRFPIVHPHDNKESVAMIMNETNESSQPIVDEDNHLLGIITHDDLMDIIALSEEEDYTKFAAISDIDIDIDSSNLKNTVKSRLPWLTILLGLSMITSIILSLFEGLLNDSSGAILLASKLAVYLPLILGMAGNTGTQSLAVMIRYLTKNDDIEPSEIKKHLMREMKTGILQGLIIGTLVFAMVNITTLITAGAINDRNLIYAGVTGLSIFIALSIATTLGALIPLIMNKAKIDPAVASGPFITTVSDIITLTIYYSVSLVILLPLFI